jgi:hypothetical protein
VRNAAAGGRAIEAVLVRVRLDPSHIVGQLLRRNLRRHTQANLEIREVRNRREVFERVVTQPPGIAVRKNGHGRHRRHQQGGAIGSGSLDGLIAQLTACAGLVLDDHGLVEPLRHAIGHQPRQRVRSGARRVAHNDLDGASLSPE